MSELVTFYSPSGHGGYLKYSVKVQRNFGHAKKIKEFPVHCILSEEKY